MGERSWAYSRSVRGRWTTIVIAAVAAVGVWFAASDLFRQLPGSPSSVLTDTNILLVSFDTTRADHLGCYGYASGRTPTIDRLAAAGVRFTRCFTPVPITLPAHASLLTGRYPFHHQLRMNRDGPLPASIPTLAEFVRKQGYRTGAVVGSVVLSADRGLARGFEHYDDDAQGMSSPGATDYASRRADAVTDAAVAWLDTVGSDRWFLWAHYFDPHTPYDAPGTASDASLDAAYDAEITYADAHLGRLLDHIAESDLRSGRSTIIIFTADHGESLGEHEELTHGFFTYNATLHVPLVIVLPERTGAGRTIDATVSLVDVMPTVLGWLKLAVPTPSDGAPLLGADGAVVTNAGPRAVYFESVVPQRWYNWAALHGAVVDKWKLIDAPKPELYDLDDDPNELDNRYVDETARAAQMEEDLRSIVEEAQQTAQPAPSDNLTPQRQRELESLGYVGTPQHGKPDAPRAADPKDMIPVHNLYLRGREEESAGRFSDALAKYKAALQADQNNPQVLARLVELLNVPAIRTAAVDALLARFDASPPLPAPWNVELRVQLAIAMGQDGKFADAEKLLAAALALDPDDRDANYYYAHTLLELGESQERAQPYLDKARRSDDSP